MFRRPIGVPLGANGDVKWITNYDNRFKGPIPLPHVAIRPGERRGVSLLTRKPALLARLILELAAIDGVPRRERVPPCPCGPTWRTSRSIARRIVVVSSGRAPETSCGPRN
jgi:hypothetical protein